MIQLNPANFALNTSLKVPNLNSPQLEIDALQTGFSHEACNWHSMAAMMAGGLTFRISRLAASEAFAALGLMGNSFTATGNRAVAWASALACEVSAFRGVNQLLSPVNLSPEQSGLNPQSWLASCADFFALKTMGRWGAGNIALNHLAQDVAVVAGRNAGFALGLSEKSDESLSQQMLHAEAMIWQMGVGIKLAGVLSGHVVNHVEHRLERSNALRNFENSINHSRGSVENTGSSLRMASPDDGQEDFDADRISFVQVSEKVIGRQVPKKAGVPNLIIGATLLLEATSFSRLASAFVAGAIRAVEWVRGTRFRSIENIEKSLSDSPEDIRFRDFLALFRNEKIRIEEISVSNPRALRNAWGSIPACFQDFLRRKPAASHLKIWRFHGADSLVSYPANRARQYYTILDEATEIRLGFERDSLSTDIYFDVLPDDFYQDAVAHQFPENPFRPEFVDHEIPAEVVRPLRRNYAYPVYDGIEPIEVHGGQATPKEARAHDWAHILILAGYSRAFVDDIMSFYDALQDYEASRGMPHNDEKDSEIHEGNLAIFMQQRGREDYPLALKRILNLYGGFSLTGVFGLPISIRTPGSLPNFATDYEEHLRQHFPEGHPRREVVLDAWQAARRMPDFGVLMVLG